MDLLGKIDPYQKKIPKKAKKLQTQHAKKENIKK